MSRAAQTHQHIRRATWGLRVWDLYYKEFSLLQSSFVELGRELITIYRDVPVNTQNFTNQLFTERNYLSLH